MAVQGLFKGGRLNASRRLWLRIGMVAGLAAACGAPSTTIDEAVFIEAMAQLASAENRFLDSARSDSAGQAILEELALTRDHLVAFADEFGADSDKMFRLFEAIRVRTDSLDAMAGRGETTSSDTGSAR